MLFFLIIGMLILINQYLVNMMKKIGIFPNEEKDKGLSITRLLIEKIESAGIQVLLPEAAAAVLDLNNTGTTEDNLLPNCDAVISLGGDGTFLGVARKAFNHNKPILGINVGNLGFLAEVDRNDLDWVVQSLAHDKYAVESRMVLDSRIVSEESESESYFAFNDVVVSRGTISRVVNIKVLFDQTMVDQFPADGIIISTPTGSTAYSLSAGGPLVEPNMDLMVITPICPHILHARSMVISEKRKVSIIVDNKYQNDSMLTIDGQRGIMLTNAQRVDIVSSDKKLRVIKLSGRSFYDTVRDKLFDRNGRRNVTGS